MSICYQLNEYCIVLYCIVLYCNDRPRMRTRDLFAVADLLRNETDIVLYLPVVWLLLWLLCDCCRWSSTGVLLWSLWQIQCTCAGATRAESRGSLWFVWSTVFTADCCNDSSAVGQFFHCLLLHICTWYFFNYWTPWLSYCCKTFEHSIEIDEISQKRMLRYIKVQGL